jgi:hypothetical protein
MTPPLCASFVELTCGILSTLDILLSISETLCLIVFGVILSIVNDGVPSLEEQKTTPSILDGIAFKNRTLVL